MVKILHLSNTYIPEDSRILKAIQSGKEDGHHVIGAGLSTPEKHHETDSREAHNIISVTLQSKKLSVLPRLFAKGFEVMEIMCKFFMLGLKDRPSIIHCHDLPALPAAILIKLFTASKLIYDAHELTSQRNGLSRLEQKLTYFAEQLFWPFIDFLIIVSPSIQKWYEINHKAKKSVVILNAPKLAKSEKSAFPNDYLRQKFGIPENQKIFIYLGFLCKGRGLDILIDAFYKDDVQSQLVIIGYGPLEHYLKQKSYGAKNIHFHSSVKHQDVIPLAQLADFGLCMIEPISLSDEYCLPNKLFEYAFSGLPVIASCLPDIKRLLHEFGLGISVENNQGTLYRLIKDIENKEIEVSNKGQDLSDLTYNAQGKKLKQLYKTIL